MFWGLQVTNVDIQKILSSTGQKKDINVEIKVDINIDTDCGPSTPLSGYPIPPHPVTPYPGFYSKKFPSKVVLTLIFSFAEIYKKF